MSLESSKNQVNSHENRDSSDRLSPSEMNDAELQLVVAEWHEKKQDIESELGEKNDEIAAVLIPVYSQIDSFLENNSILDEETKNQVVHISNRGFGKSLNRLGDEKTIAELGKGISLLREKGILTDELIEEISSLEDSVDSLEASLRQLDTSENADYAYTQEYFTRQLAQ